MNNNCRGGPPRGRPLGNAKGSAKKGRPRRAAPTVAPKAHERKFVRIVEIEGQPSGPVSSCGRATYNDELNFILDK